MNCFIESVNLMCARGTHAQRKTLERKNDLLRYFVTYGFSFIEKSPSSILLLAVSFYVGAFSLPFWD